jgi:hypothetical protein
MTLTILASIAQSRFYETIRFEESGKYEKETGQWNKERKRRERRQHEHPITASQ